MKKLLLGLAVTSFLLALIFAWQGYHQLSEPVYPVVPPLKQTGISLCPNRLWTTLKLQHPGEQPLLLENTELFERYPTQPETQGRHEGELSVRLSAFVHSVNETITVQTCAGKYYIFSQAELDQAQPRLVLNQKGALKLLAGVSENIRLVDKYLYSITIRDDTGPLNLGS